MTDPYDENTFTQSLKRLLRLATSPSDDHQKMIFSTIRFSPLFTQEMIERRERNEPSNETVLLYYIRIGLLPATTKLSFIPTRSVRPVYWNMNRELARYCAGMTGIPALILRYGFNSVEECASIIRAVERIVDMNERDNARLSFVGYCLQNLDVTYRYIDAFSGYINDLISGICEPLQPSSRATHRGPVGWQLRKLACIFHVVPAVRRVAVIEMFARLFQPRLCIGLPPPVRDADDGFTREGNSEAAGLSGPILPYTLYETLAIGSVHAYEEYTDSLRRAPVHVEDAHVPRGGEGSKTLEPIAFYEKYYREKYPTAIRGLHVNVYAILADPSERRSGASPLTTREIFELLFVEPMFDFSPRSVETIYRFDTEEVHTRIADAIAEYAQYIDVRLERCTHLTKARFMAFKASRMSVSPQGASPSPRSTRSQEVSPTLSSPTFTSSPTVFGARRSFAINRSTPTRSLRITAPPAS